MAWVVGVDEAGYGPNLGPFVMTSVACRVPDDLAGADLWHVLRAAVRRPEDAADGRLPVGDSKALYSRAAGLVALETTVLAALTPDDGPLPLQRYLDPLCPSARAALGGEPWYHGSTALPVEAAPDVMPAARARLARTLRDAGVTWGQARSVIVCAGRFNALADAAGSKGAVLGHALAELVRHNWGLDGEEESLSFFVDKHGGRNTYAALLQDAVPEGMVVAHQEGMARSVYSVCGVKRPVRWTFQPRADAEHFCVALASMVSKYLRELLMGEFNAFWRKHVPDLKPTAGYPSDAKRFYEAIRPLLPGLGLGEDAVWRRR